MIEREEAHAPAQAADTCAEGRTGLGFHGRFGRQPRVKAIYGTATPSLTVTEVGDSVRLELAGIARGEGRSLQDAADALVDAVLRLATAVRSNGVRVTPEVPGDVELFDYLYQLGELAAAGGDVRQRLFG